MSKAPATYFMWKDGFELGIPRFDQEHRQLLRVTEELHAAVVRGNDVARSRAILERLAQHAAIHFHHEAEYLLAFNYPGLRDQRDEHESFLRDIARVRLGTSEAVRDALALARDLVVRHILSLDKEYAAWLLKAAGLAKADRPSAPVLGGIPPQ